MSATVLKFKPREEAPLSPEVIQSRMERLLYGPLQARLPTSAYRVMSYILENGAFIGNPQPRMKFKDMAAGKKIKVTQVIWAIDHLHKESLLAFTDVTEDQFRVQTSLGLMQRYVDRTARPGRVD